MSYTEISKRVKTDNWSMANLHSHNYYEFYFLLKGKRDFFIENSLYTILEDMLVIIPPFAMHKTEGGAFARININISESFFENDEKELLKALSDIRILKIIPKIKKEVLEILNKLYLLQQHNKNIDKVTVKILLKYLILILFESREETASTTHEAVAKEKVPPVVLKAVKYINNNFNQDINLKKISSEFFFSCGYLSKIFKNYTGFTVSEYLLNSRLNHAKKLLETTKNSIENIAQSTGFSSANYFSLIFKQKVGISPINYRKNNIEN